MSNLFVDLNSRATLLKHKIDRLSTSLQNSASFNTKEVYMAEAAKVLQKFYSDLNAPFFQYEDALRDGSPFPTTNSVEQDKFDYDYNLIWDQLIENLTILFLEMENLESLSIANYNFAMTEANRLTNRLKSVSSKVGDYILYSQNTLSDVFLVKDSFNNVSKIDLRSRFLNEKECTVNEEEGIITLPIANSGSKIISVRNAPHLNDDSNGKPGNNELAGPANADISVILDNNPDTWFEYEKLVTVVSDDEDPLVLDMVIDLETPQVINHIIINPNNFGTKTTINIETLETSLSGEVYTSIKDDIPIPGYEIEDEANVFTLAPSTSKYTGQGIYTFTPRKTRYIHITLVQSEPYRVTTLTEVEKLRYAIGIRDITIKALKFDNKGELVSLPLLCPKEIRKVMLEVSQTPVKDSELTNIKYLISHNEGGGWNEIQPKHLSGASGVASVKEILNFNNADLDSFTTKTPVTSVRLKIVLEREDSNFIEGSSALAKQIERISEVQGVPVSAPFTITLNNPPVEDTITLVDPLFGSRGIRESAYTIKTGEENTQEDVISGIPFTKINIPMKKDGDNNVVPQSASDWLFIYIGGERWNQRTGSNWTTTGKYFHFDHIEGSLSFNPDDVGSDQPPDNSSISMHFGAEKLFPGEQLNNHVAALEYPTSNSKEDFQIIHYGKEVTVPAESITDGISSFQLKNKNITLSSSTPAIDTWTRISFINGADEFTSVTTNFSVDAENGIVYFGQPPVNLSIGYKYIPKTILSETDWDWTGDGLIKQVVSIKESGWAELELTESITLATNTNSFGLSKMAIVKGTIIFPSSDTAFRKEMTFQNGTDEFQNAGDAGNKQFSVDYKNGIVYLSEAYHTGQPISISYSYTDYKALYRIARKINSKNYEIDIPNKQIAIKDSEIFRHLETPKTKTAYYLVNYDYVKETRENVEELKDYFTPVVKDYILRILKKGTIGVLS